MDMEYLEQIGASLGIVKGQKESTSDYYRRVAYSAIADWMQTSVFVGGDATSIVQVKRIALDKARIMEELSPGLLVCEIDELIEHIFNILLQNGVFLHRNFYVRPAPHRLIGNDSFAIVRGMCPEEHVCFSGLAPFLKQRNAPCNVYSAFGLPEIEIENITRQLWDRASRVDMDTHIGEYLNTSRSTRQPYYCSSPPDRTGMLLGRSRRNDSCYDYYLIFVNEIRRVSEDHVDVALHEYARLDLMEKKQVQTATATFDGPALVHVSFSYRLPKPDLRFLQFVSWPYKRAGLNDVWNFSLHGNLWPIVKARLEFLKYKVVEKNA